MERNPSVTLFHIISFGCKQAFPEFPQLFLFFLSLSPLLQSVTEEVLSYRSIEIWSDVMFSYFLFIGNAIVYPSTAWLSVETLSINSGGAWMKRMREKGKMTHVSTCSQANSQHTHPEDRDTAVTTHTTSDNSNTYAQRSAQPWHKPTYRLKDLIFVTSNDTHANTFLWPQTKYLVCWYFFL